MKIAICDDEKHYCKQIQECVEIYLDKHHIYGKTEIFMDGNALLERGIWWKSAGNENCKRGASEKCNASDCICVGIY